MSADDRKPFAKLFETSDYGQICVMQGKNDEDAPEIRFYVQPPGLGVCSFAMGFDDSDDGFDKADAAFEKVDLAMARVAAKSVFDMIKDPA
jgi:hypothetical protein